MVRKKNKKRELTHEEKQEKIIKNDWMYLEGRIKYISEPTIKFEIGQEVQIGNLRNCVIEEQFENGKIYLINYTDYKHNHSNLIEKGKVYIINYNNDEHNYSNPIEIPNSKRLVVWHDIHLGDIEASNLAKKDDIRISYHQTQLNELISKVYSFGVDFNPEYQRDHVWNLEDKIALIDSIFNSVDIGKFSFVHNDDNKWRETGYSYEILDGKQRLTALCEFYEGRFEYKGFKFRDLSPRDRNHFENYNVNIGEVQNATEKQIMEYFVKLNTHGRVMDKEHLEKVKAMIETK